MCCQLRGMPSGPTEDTALRRPGGTLAVFSTSELRRTGEAEPRMEPLIVAEEDTSDQLQFVPIDLYGKRTLDRINRDHQTFGVILREDPFQPIQAATAHANTLPHV